MVSSFFSLTLFTSQGTCHVSPRIELRSFVWVRRSVIEVFDALCDFGSTPYWASFQRGPLRAAERHGAAVEGG